MNANIAHSMNASWLRQGIAVVGTLLISGTIAFGLVNRTPVSTAPASAPVAKLSDARERIAAFKDAQAELHDATVVPVSVSPSASAYERYLALKDAQAEMHDATVVPAPAPAAWFQHYTALKDAQLELHDTTVVPAPLQGAGRARFADLKQTQAELREEGR